MLEIYGILHFELWITFWGGWRVSAPNSAQALLLSLHSAMASGGLERSCGTWGLNLTCKARAIPAELILWPWLNYFYLQTNLRRYSLVLFSTVVNSPQRKCASGLYWNQRKIVLSIFISFTSITYMIWFELNVIKMNGSKLDALNG